MFKLPLMLLFKGLPKNYPKENILFIMQVFDIYCARKMHFYLMLFELEDFYRARVNNLSYP